MREILQESGLVKLCCSAAEDVRRGNETAGHANSLNAAPADAGDNCCGVCTFLRNGWDKRIQEIARPEFEAYIRRCPPEESPAEEQETEQDVPVIIPSEEKKKRRGTAENIAYSNYLSRLNRLNSDMISMKEGTFANVLQDDRTSCLESVSEATAG